MLNPIFKNKNFAVGYFAGWLLISILQIFMVLYFYSSDIYITVAESLIFNSLYAIIGIGVWYPVYYTDLEKNKLSNFITNHLASSSLAVGLWLWIGYILLTTIFSDKITYIQRLNNTIPWRVGMGFFLYVLLTVIYYLMIYYQNFKEKLLRESELKALVKESELSSLKSQINPHFLFNSLNSISSLTMISPERAQEMVINLSEFLRYSLSHKKEILTTFDNELKNLDRYLMIEKIRFGKRLNVKKDIDEHSLRYMLPALILQPVIENAVKYGVYESIDESNILVESKAYENLLEVKVSNEYDPDFMVKKGSGIGLKNITSRLRIQYGREDLIKITKAGSIFEIVLRFPQNK